MTALCVVGIYVSFFMLRKQTRAAQGLLSEPSVVTSPRARAAGVSNALIGIFYYCGLLALSPFLHFPLAWTLALAAAVLAAIFSAYLAYSLLFVTRMPCAYCWIGHAVNWSLLALLAFWRELSFSH